MKIHVSSMLATGANKHTHNKQTSSHTCTLYTCTCNVHDVIRDVDRKKERKKERHLRLIRQWKNENESCLKWDSNPRHSVLRTDALPTELPRQLSWQGPNQTSHTPV